MEEANDVLEQTDEKIDSLEIKFQKVSSVSGCLVVSMNGYIDTYNAPHFKRQVDKVIDTGYVRLVFDFSGISYISSTGIGAFVQFLKEVKPRSGDMVLVGMVERVFDVFHLLGFSSFFHVESSLEDAVHLLAVQSEGAGKGPFPKVFGCPICYKRLRTNKDGRFRCSECKTIIVINMFGHISLG